MQVVNKPVTNKHVLECVSQNLTHKTKSLLIIFKSNHKTTKKNRPALMFQLKYMMTIFSVAPLPSHHLPTLLHFVSFLILVICYCAFSGYLPMLCCCHVFCPSAKLLWNTLSLNEIRCSLLLLLLVAVIFLLKIVSTGCKFSSQRKYNSRFQISKSNFIDS